MHKHTVLDNKLNVISSRMRGMASVSLGVWIKVGGRYETEQRSGISHLVEHMLFKGTPSRSAKKLKQSIEGVGGAFNGFTSDEVTCYMVKVPAKHTELGLDVLSDMVLRAKFSPTDLAREKFVIYEEIKMYKDQPSEHVLELLAELMWPGNALGRPLTGTIDSVRAIKRQHLADFRNTYYHSGNMSVVSAGDVDHVELGRLSAKYFSKCRSVENPGFDAPAISRGASRVRFARGNVKQAHIAMGFYCDAGTNRERLAVKLMSIILGGNMSSRLFDGLREERGLCYDISSAYKKHSDVGEVQIHAGVDNGKAVSAVTAIIDELKKIADRGVSPGELTRAKEYAKGQFLLAIEGTSTRMLWMGDRFLTHGGIPDVKKVVDEIDSLSGKDIRKAARDVFTPGSANLALVSRVGTKEKQAIRRQVSRL